MRNSQTQESAKVKISIPEPYKGTNWDLLEKYKDKFSTDDPECYLSDRSVFAMLEEIQSRLVSDMPKIGEEYEFEDDFGIWNREILHSFETNVGFRIKLRPISPIPPEISSAIKLLEDSNYIVTKK